MSTREPIHFRFDFISPFGYLAIAGEEPAHTLHGNPLAHGPAGCHDAVLPPPLETRP